MTSTSGTVASGGPSHRGAPEDGAPPGDGTAPGDGDGGTAASAGSAGSAGRGYEPMSIRGPALIVLGLAVLLLLGGVVASAVTSGTDPTFTLRQVTLADGTTVPLAPAAARLHAIVSNDEPPADIIGNLGIPKESVVTGVLNSDQHTAQFDRTARLRSQLSQTEVVDVYAHLLRAVGWQVIYQGPAPQGSPGSTEVLAKRGSGDGFYWETGVVVSPTTPEGSTSYSVEVFETPDGN
jgi:hypothetical protein